MLAVAGIVCVPAVAGGAPAVRFPRFGAGCVREDVPSMGSLVRAEFCRATRPTGAAVIVLHGCGGFSTFDHRLATTLPRYGISTLDLDYFEPTRPPGTKGFCNAPSGFETAFPRWIRVTTDAATKLRGIAGVRHVGIVGWSLGGGVAVAAAASNPGRFDALAGFSTGAFGAAGVASRLPPTILLSGGSTDAIPLSETLPLYQSLRRAHVPAELYVYPRGSHDWPGKQGALGIARTSRFLLEHLR